MAWKIHLYKCNFLKFCCVVVYNWLDETLIFLQFTWLANLLHQSILIYFDTSILQYRGWFPEGLIAPLLGLI